MFRPVNGLRSFATAKVRRLIICGAPASGKGTQCEKIVEEFKIPHLSTGDMLRAAVKAGSPLGKEARAYMDAGKLVPDSLVINLVKETLATPEFVNGGWLLDGCPRTAEQAKALQHANFNPDKVILLDVPDSALIERVTGRRSDPVTGAIPSNTAAAAATFAVLLPPFSYSLHVVPSCQA
jgi:adenylate kinase